MDTKLKEALEAKNPLIYAADDNGIEISYKGSVGEIMSLVGTLMLSVSNETGIPLDKLLVDLVSATSASLIELKKEHEEERKVGKN